MSKRVCVFCGSADGVNPAYKAAAVALGQGIAARGWSLVYGGSQRGLMGTVANATLDGGGEVVGIIPESLKDGESAYSNLTELHIVESMHVRKALMEKTSDAIIALPGGFGTLEEFAEIVTWAQLGHHRKPVCLLNIENFYTPLITFIDHMVTEGFVRSHHKDLIVVQNAVEPLLTLLETYDPPHINKWAEPEVK